MFPTYCHSKWGNGRAQNRGEENIDMTMRDLQFNSALAAIEVAESNSLYGCAQIAQLLSAFDGV